MSLDFSALDDISNESFKWDLNKDDNDKVIINKTVLNDDIHQQRYLKIEQYKKVYSKVLQVYITYQENTKKSEKLRIEINKAIKADMPTAEILDKCLKCISLMTDDEAFYRQNTKCLFQK